MRVLFVDDNPNLLHSFRRQLRSRFEVEIASGVRRGMEIAREKEAFEIIVADMNMPEMNGFEFLKQVQSMNPFSVLLMLSGDSRPEVGKRAENELGIFRFLLKPCSLETLMNTLEQARQEYLSRIMLDLMNVSRDEQLTVLAHAPASDTARPSQLLTLAELRAGMQLATDLNTVPGWKLLPAGTILTTQTIHKINNFHRLQRIAEPISISGLQLDLSDNTAKAA